VNDELVAEGRIERTQPMIFSADETADVGEDDATPVTEDYEAYDNGFTGKILEVTVDVREMGAGVKADAARRSTGGVLAESSATASRRGDPAARSERALRLRGRHRDDPAAEHRRDDRHVLDPEFRHG